MTLEGGMPTKAAVRMPFWFYHGTDDKVLLMLLYHLPLTEYSKVVKFELGCQSYNRALQLGLRAQFKRYEGLGHEYGSEEMIDVQKFFFRRIPEDLADTVPEPFDENNNVMHGFQLPVSNRQVQFKYTVGGVSAFFNVPWQYAISSGLFKKEGIQVEWQDCQGGTGSMVDHLNNGSLDIAILSTDGALAEISQGGLYRIIAPFVDSPLKYGVYVAPDSDVRSTYDLEGQVFAISRKGSLSHVMTYLHATQSNWNPKNWDRTRASLLEVGNLAGALTALRSGKAHGFLWEIGAAKTLVDKGELRLVGYCATPWPSFVIAARNSLLESRGGIKGLQLLLDCMQQACREFQEWPGRMNLMVQKYGIRPDDARARLEETSWSCENKISDEVLDEVAFTLVAVGLLKTFPATDDIFASLADLRLHFESNVNDEGGGEMQLEAGEDVGRLGVARTHQENSWNDDGRHEPLSQEEHNDVSTDSSLPSYEPEFKKTEQGTYEVTGITGEVQDVLKGRKMTSTWRPSNVLRPVQAQQDRNEEDDQISAILEKSAMLSSKFQERNSHSSQQKVKISPRTESAHVRFEHCTSGKSYAFSGESHFSHPGFSSRGRQEDLLANNREASVSSVDRHSRRPTEVDDSFESKTGSRNLTPQLDPSSSSLSSNARAKNVALSLRKLRDSAVAMRKSAAKALRGYSDASHSSPYQQIPPVSLFKNSTGADVEYQDIKPSRMKAQEKGGLSGDMGDVSSLRTSDSAPFQDGRSLEDHTVEFRHTLRKSVHKDVRSHEVMRPQSLFDEARQEGRAKKEVECPICLESIEPENSFLTTCAHKFHKTCFEDYTRKSSVANKRQCPVCRTAQHSRTREAFSWEVEDSPSHRVFQMQGNEESLRDGIFIESRIYDDATVHSPRAGEANYEMSQDYTQRPNPVFANSPLMSTIMKRKPEDQSDHDKHDLASMPLYSGLRKPSVKSPKEKSRWTDSLLLSQDVAANPRPSSSVHRLSNSAAKAPSAPKLDLRELGSHSMEFHSIAKQMFATGGADFQSARETSQVAEAARKAEQVESARIESSAHAAVRPALVDPRAARVRVMGKEKVTEHVDVREAVKEANKASAKLLVGAGRHAWKGDATLRRTEMNVTAEEGAMLLGQVRQTVRLALLRWVPVAVQGGEWRIAQRSRLLL
eukprot:754563-Hanusia_phi.AAC.4